MDIYERIGAKKVINAYGTVTIIGGSLMHTEVLAAMKEASESFVDLVDFHHKSGAHIAKLAGCEACCITNGAAGGIVTAISACMAGTDPAKIRQLPVTIGMKNEAVVLKAHRTLYDQAMLLSGVRVKEVGKTSAVLPEEVAWAIDDNTACVFYTSECETMRGSLPIETIVEIAHGKNVPVVVDAASEIPPKDIFKDYLAKGADLVILSGGKEIRGPQSAGLIFGTKTMIEACHANCCPQYSTGRPLKLDKETIAGMVRAFELFWERDYDAITLQWENMTNEMARNLAQIQDAEVWVGYTSEPGIQPMCLPKVFFRSSRMEAKALHAALIDRTPAIYTCRLHDTILLNGQCLQESEMDIVCDAIRIEVSK